MSGTRAVTFPVHRTRRVIAVAAVAAAAVAMTAVPGHADLGAPSSTQTRTVTRTPTPTPHLVDIRTGRHATYDRVVLDLRGAAPGYKVGYVRTVREDGSGRVLDLRGHANLLVRLTPADAHRDDGSPTYTGRKHVDVDYPELREVAFAGDFEGTVAVALGVRTKNGFRVLTLHDPTRIVIDIAH